MVGIVRLLRAECYKLLKSKTFKILCGIALVLSLLMVASSGDEFSTLDSLNITTEHEKQAYLDEYLMQIKALPLVTPGQIAFQPISETSPFELTALDVFHASFGVGVVEILLGILIGTHVASEYSSGTIKNTLAYGAKRNQYYLAKFMSLVFGAAIIVAIMTLLSTSIVTLFKGWGQPFEYAHFIEIISVYCGSLVVFSAVIALLMFLASVVKSNGATVGITMAFFVFVPAMIGTFYGTNDWFDQLYELTLYYNVGIVTSFKATSGDILQGVMFGVATLVTTLGLGLIVFNKQDIK